MHRFNPGGAYVNFMMDDEGEARVQASYGEQLCPAGRGEEEIRSGNLFRVNQNIRPAA